jgi:hypothetical protein
MKNALTIVPKLKSGGDAGAADKLLGLFDDAQHGLRKIIALGLYAWHLKENELKHGEWGPWLAANRPELSRLDSATGNPKASNQLTTYMHLTKGALEKVGFKTIGGFLKKVSKFPVIGNLPAGGFLLIEDKKVPAEVKPLHDKICELVDGKTQNQLFWEFKQADEDSDKPKRGRLKGSSGLTKEQRERAAARAEQERLNELEEWAGDTADELLENADAKNAGMLPVKARAKLLEAVETMGGFLRRVAASQGDAK